MSSPQVGDVLTTPEQLDACPTGTLLRDREEYGWYREPGDEWRVLPPHGDEGSFTRPINKALGPFTVVHRG